MRRPYMVFVHVDHASIDDIHRLLEEFPGDKLAVSGFQAFQRGHDLALFFETDSDHPSRALFQGEVGADLLAMLRDRTSLDPDGVEPLVALDTRLAGAPGGTLR